MDQRRLIALFVACVSCVLGVTPLEACPVVGQSLWTLVHQADAIVLLVPSEAGPFQHVSLNGPTRYEVVESWKGSPPAMIELPWLPGDCGPDEATRPRLVFLKAARGASPRERPEDEDEDEDVLPAETPDPAIERLDPLFPRALPMCPTDDQLEVLRERVDEAQRVLARADPDERRRYLVESLALRVTREDAGFELLRHGADRRLLVPPSPTEQAFVARGFLDEPAADDGLPALLTFLEGYRDPLFDDTVLASLDEALATDAPDPLLILSLQIVLERQAPGARLEQFVPESGLEEGWTGPSLREAWSRAREQYRLPG